jgi:hypothetical protein
MKMLTPPAAEPAWPSYPMAAAFPFATGHAFEDTGRVPARAGAFPMFANPFAASSWFPAPFGSWPALAPFARPASPFDKDSWPRLFLGYCSAPSMAMGFPYEGWGLLTLGFAVPPGMVKFAGNPAPVWLAA